MLVAVSLLVAWFHCVFAAVVVVLAFEEIKTTTNFCGGILVLPYFLL